MVLQGRAEEGVGRVGECWSHRFFFFFFASLLPGGSSLASLSLLSLESCRVRRTRRRLTAVARIGSASWMLLSSSESPWPTLPCQRLRQVCHELKFHQFSSTDPVEIRQRGLWLACGSRLGRMLERIIVDTNEMISCSGVAPPPPRKPWTRRAHRPRCRRPNGGH